MATAVERISTGILPQQRPWRLSDGLRARSDRRLTEVFGAAEHLIFDDSSRFVFFSDLHRGNNSRADAFAGNEDLFLQALSRYYREGFTYIEVGDGDELAHHRMAGPPPPSRHLRTHPSPDVCRVRRFVL